MRDDYFGWLALGGLLAAFGGPRSAGASGYSQAVLSDTPVAYYRLDDSGRVITDLSGNGHNGVLEGKPRYTPQGLLPTDPGGAIAFDRQGYIQIPDKSDLDFANKPFSVEAWFQCAGIPDGDILSKSAFGTTQGYQLEFWHNTLYFGGSKQIQISYPWQAGKTYYVVGEANGDGAGSLFINGIQVKSGAVADTWDYRGPLIIGANANGGQTFSGALSQVALYNQALSGPTITAHFAAGTTPAPSSLWILLGGAIPGFLLLRRRKGLRAEG